MSDAKGEGARDATMQPEETIDKIILGVMQDAAFDIVPSIQGTIDTDYPPASGSGDPPHRRTGLLWASIDAYVEQSGPITTLTVISGAPYSGFLERGTSRMEARPFMGPAQEAWAEILYQRFTEAFSVGNVLAAA